MSTEMSMISPAISGTLLTVPVVSLVAYSILSAGTSASVCPTIQHPTLSKMSSIFSELWATLNPGMDSSLSNVPPV